MFAVDIPESEKTFFDLAARVQRSSEPVFLMRYGQAIARIVPVEASLRDVSPDPALGQIEIKGDLFAETSADWESA